MACERLALVWMGLVATACIATNPPPPIRWFDPSIELADPSSASRRDDGAILSLRPVTASAFLRQEMIWRIAPREVFIDETNRWVADPAALVQHALEVVLFAEGPFRRADLSAENEAHVHVLAFEGDLDGPAGARVRLLLRARGRPPATVEALADADGESAADLADAMAAALRGAAEQIRDRLSP